MAIWSTVMIEVWKRREHEIAHLWNMKGNSKNDDTEVTDFKADF
jgi:hypothetical protein